MPGLKEAELKEKYVLDREGRFIIDNYNCSALFSNFFPGIAGVWGIPMWVFYVNRGQGIASFGLQSKDGAIMEFQPANKAYRSASLQGFRTFIKVRSGRQDVYWEPFQAHLPGTAFSKKVRMIITAHDLTLEEVNEDLGLMVQVNYFTLPDEDYAALVRRVTVSNLNGRAVSLDMVDGLPAVTPYGLKDWTAKNMSRTVEAWSNVHNLENKAPYYHLKVEVSDQPRVTHIHEGHFYFACSLQKGSPLWEPIIDSQAVFGSSADWTAPELFLNKKFALPKIQHASNRTPSALAFAAFTIPGKKTHEMVSLLGHARSVERLNAAVGQARSGDFIAEKARRNREIIEEIKQYAFTRSANSAFDQYAGNTFLDNVLRGGLPVSLKTCQGQVAFNVFSRKHGDPERDYNHFTIAPTFFSQGNGNYRDVNQNRRNDVWFNSDVRDNHLVNFLNLSQADGYNPLVVKGASFRVSKPEDVKRLLAGQIKGPAPEELVGLLRDGFLPGDLLRYLEETAVPLKEDARVFLGQILEACQKQELAEHGEGFWTDHWTYNLDLVESYLALYPEDLRRLLLDKKDFEFYLSDHYVLPRDQRYVLTPNGVRQYASVARLKDRPANSPNRLRTREGAGPVYQTTLLVKLLCLIANKAASLDPSGIGVEMEADKPNWYDALNGLPGLLGSSISETFEIKRFSAFVLEALARLAVADQDKVVLFDELATFVSGLTHVLCFEKEPLAYWNKSNDIKEHYRHKVRSGISGPEKEMTFGDIKKFLKLVIERCEVAALKAVNSEGFLATYFYHEVVSHKPLDKTAAQGAGGYVRPVKFQCRRLPLFLEGFVHALRVAGNKDEASALFRQVCQSGLYDHKLKMFRVNDDLSGETEEIGRTRIFPAGWLENRSIWLHMEYKFMLELLRQGLYEEFYLNSKSVFIPFMKPQVYGRSILENSSFIVSSAHEDASLHGRGFVARLSGSTAEFMHMWLIINAGPRPFTLDPKNGLVLQLQPVLPGEYFTTRDGKFENHVPGRGWETVSLPAGTYAFKLFGRTLVVYHNPGRRDTFGPDAAVVRKIVLTYPDQKPVILKSAVIPAPYAGDVRDRKVARIDIDLG
jgi:hypothetical protein